MDYFYTNAYLRGNKIFLRGYSNGKRFVDDISYKPYLFVNGNGDYQTVYGEPLIKKEFDNIKKAREFIELYNSSSNVDFYGFTNFTNVFLNEEFPDKVNYNPKLISIVSLDIEVSSKEGMPDVDLAIQPVTAITLVRNKKTITFGTKAYTGKNSYCLCDNEGEMLRSFLHMINDDPYWMPDVITGWSVDLFDIPYLVNRVRRILGEDWVKKFSPYGQVYQKNIVRAKSNSYSKDANERTDIIYDLAGITVLDYLQLYKKFSSGSQESYALNNIAKLELGRGKHDYSDIGSLDALYELDFNRYVDYNVEDAILVEEIEQKKKYLQIIFSIAYKAKINYIDAMTTSRPWDAIIHNHLLKKKIAIPQSKEPPLRVDFVGAYVKEPQIGLHHWVVSFDFDALYPTILSQHNISPETFIGKTNDITIETCLTKTSVHPSVDPFIFTANGCLFSKDKRGFIPEIVDEYVAERVNVKNKMIQLKKDDPNSPEIESLDHYQQALKILNNGLYGSLGQKHFRWFDLRFAEAVTTTAQVCTRYVEQQLNIYLNKILKTNGVDYVIAADTDSVYISFGKLVEALGSQVKSSRDITTLLDKLCKAKFQPLIERCCLDLSKSFGVVDSKLKMKREAICEKAIWRAAKQYILNIWDLEGVRHKEPILKYKGIEVVRSSTPMVCRDNLKKCLSIIMNKTEADLQKFIKQFYNEYKKMTFEQVAFPRSVNASLTEYADPISICRKQTPVHVRGALVYNHLLEKMNLKNKYPPIREKDKIRFAYLKEPNITGSHVIAAPDELPKEFGLSDYVDVEIQWERAFKNPIKSITDVIHWQIEKIARLPI